MYFDRSKVDSYKEALFTLPWRHIRPLHDRIRTARSNSLHSSWCPKTQDLLFTPLLPRRLERISDRKEDCRTHEQRRLAHTARALDRAQVLPLHVLEQAHVELLRNVPEARDLVRAWALSEHLS